MPRTRPEHPLIAAGVLGPFIVCAGTAPFRDSLANTNVTLVLVLEIGAVAAGSARSESAVKRVGAGTIRRSSMSG